MPSSLPRLGISLRNVILRFPGDPRRVEHLSNANRRFLFQFEGGIADDGRALRFADTLSATLTLVYGPLTDEVPQVLRLPASTIRGETLSARKAVEASVGPAELDPLPPEFVRVQLGRCVLVPDTVLAEVFQLLPITFVEPYFTAIHHYVASAERYSFLGDGVGEVLSDDTARPVPQKYAVRAQDAVESAYKAVESLIGEPPKDGNKLRIKLTGIGAHPNRQEIWWPGRPAETVVDKVRRLHEHRDKRAAHTRTSLGKPFTYFEVMDAQAVARVLILTAIDTEQKKGNSSR